MLCSHCKNAQASLRLPYAPLSLCPKCFKSFVERKVQRTIKDYHMVKDSDKIAIAVSGGKDSAVLLHVLNKLYPSVEKVAVHLNLGIPNYSDDCVKLVKELIRLEGLSGPIVVDVKQYLGFSTVDLLQTRFKEKLCSPCGAIKRYALNRIAYEHGCVKLATGHNLDDTVATLWDLYVKGEVDQAVKLQPVTPSNHPKLVTRIKPLVELTDFEIRMYAFYEELPILEAACPYSKNSKLLKRKGLISAIEKEYLGFKHTFLKSHVKRITPRLIVPDAVKALNECKECSMPTPSQICSVCRLKTHLRLKGRADEVFIGKENPLQESLTFV